MTLPRTDPSAAVLIIGAEVLSGKVADENAPFLIRSLRQRGIHLAEVRVIDDVVDIIVEAVRQLRPRVTYLFTTGGIGPTHDDVTIEAVARALGRRVVHHPDILAKLEARYQPLDEAHRRLAAVPEGAELVYGPDGVMPTIAVDGVFVMPGVPSLMRGTFANVAPRLGGSPFYTQVILLDVSESRIADHLTRVQHEHPEVAIGSYPRFGVPGWKVKVTIDGRDATAVVVTARAIRDGLEPAWIVDGP